MKSTRWRPELFCLWCLLLGAAGVAGAAPPARCAAAARKVEKDVGARPERVLIVVEDALVVDEECACEVVKAAIIASKAGPKLVGQIVFTAVTATPRNAALIAECAAAVSPDAGSEIKAALTKALGEESVAAAIRPAPAAVASEPADAKAPSDKNAAKNPLPEATAAEPAPAPVAVGGVYLVYPAGGTAQTREIEEITRTIVRRVQGKPKVIVIRQPTATSSEDLPRH